MTHAQTERGVFVSGIDTGVGKTVASAVLRQALGADYWKPVQAGDLDRSDTRQVAAWTDPSLGTLFPERYALQTPMSPHAAAERDGLQLAIEDFRLPDSTSYLVVEGAGGLLVPLNDDDTILDLMEHLGLPAVLVSRHYLGSINHTLLSLEALQRRNIRLRALIFNGPEDPETELVILRRSHHETLLRLPPWPEVSRERVADLATTWRPALASWLASDPPNPSK